MQYLSFSHWLVFNHNTLKVRSYCRKLQDFFLSCGWITFHFVYRCAAKSLQSCPTLCDPIDGSPPGSPVPGILQARTLEWVAISCSNACKWKVKSLSRVRPLAWTAAYQTPPSMGFSRQEYWSGVPYIIDTDLSDLFPFICWWSLSLFPYLGYTRVQLFILIFCFQTLWMYI